MSASYQTYLTAESLPFISSQHLRVSPKKVATKNENDNGFNLPTSFKPVRPDRRLYGFGESSPKLLEEHL